MKKFVALLLALVMVVGLVACGPKQPTQQTNPPASDPTKAPADPDPTKAPDPTKEPEPAEPIELEWWINFGSGYEETLDKIVEGFNQSQNKYHVTYIYQGGAPELLAKVQSSTQENLPDIFSGPGENIALYADAEFCVPIQQFIDADTEGWPELEGTWPGLRGGYQDSEGNQIGYPIGSSYAGLFYNATMMKEAGINPEEDIKSHADLYEVAKKMVEEGYCKYGMGFHKNGFYFHGAIGREGLQLFNNNNGLTGEIVTECMYTKDDKVYAAIYEMLDNYQKMHRENLVIPYGTSTQGEVIPAYAAGDCAMFTGVISYTAKVIKAVNGAFEIGFMALPSATEDGIRGGHPNSGTGSWIANTGDPERMQGAYEFIKWTSKGEWAAMWAIQTGYLAPNEQAYNDPAYQDYLKNTFPAIIPLYESIAKDDGTAANPYVGVMDVMKSANNLLFSTVCSDPDSSILDAVKAAEDTIQEALDLYNMAN